MPKKNQHWWSVYNAIFKALHGRDPTRQEYSPRSGDATNAAFEALGLPTMEKPKGLLELVEDQSARPVT